MARTVQFLPISNSTADVVTIATSAGGTVSCSLAARPGQARHLTQIDWYHAAPSSAANVTAYNGTSSGTVIFQIGVNSTYGSYRFNYPKRSSVGNALTVVISTGSTGYVYLNISGFAEE